LLRLFPRLSPGRPLAQNYPSKPIRMIVPFPAGGATDILARALSQKLGEKIGQTVVVDNRPGAGGTIGADAASKSPADGYTLLLATSSTHSIGPAINPKIPYNAETDFTPIAYVASSPNVVLVPNSSPSKNMREFIDHARKNPGRLNYASSGNGTIVHLTSEYFKAQSGTFILHIPYRGTALAMPDLISGKVDVLFDSFRDGHAARPGRQATPTPPPASRSSRATSCPPRIRWARRPACACCGKGGNAVDAAIAAAAAMTIVRAGQQRPGQRRLCILWDGKELHGLNASGRAPAGWTPDYFEKKYGRRPRRPSAASTRSRCPAPSAPGWRCPSASASCLSPTCWSPPSRSPSAATCCRWWSSRSGRRHARTENRSPASRRASCPGAARPTSASCSSSRRRRARCADRRRPRARLSTAARSRRPSRASAGERRRHRADLAAYKPEWVKPIAKDYRGYTLHEIPPNGQGIAALIALGILRTSTWPACRSTAPIRSTCRSRP
jgi:hypothetical protein